MASGITGDADSGREAVQEAFARLLAAAGPDAVGRTDGWVWVAVVNSAWEHRRRRRRRRRERWSHPVAAPPERPGPGPQGLDPRVRAALAALPERQRTALFLRHHVDLDHAGIAAATGITPRAVGATITAAPRAARAWRRDGRDRRRHRRPAGRSRRRPGGG